MAQQFFSDVDINGLADITSAAGTAHLLTLHNTTNGGGASINFSDQTNGAQNGTIDFFHSDGVSQGGGAGFHITSTEPDMVLKVGGRIVATAHSSNSEVDYGFVDDFNTGMMRSGADAIRFVTGGTAALDIDSSQNATFAGTVTGTTLIGTSLDINGAADISGALTGVDAITMNGALGGATTITASGEIEGGSLDINGNADISGNITSAGWTGDVIASAYLDTDTMHLSGNQTVGGIKSFSGDANFAGVVDITNSTEATNSTGDTGALRVEGGISSGGHIYAEGLMSQMGRAEIDSETSRLFPIGHYSTGKEVFSIDPTWTEQQLQAYFDDANVTWATESDAPAGYSILITGGVNVGIPYASGFPLIPIDDTSVYFTECWIKNVGTDQRHYMGSAEKKEDFGNPSSGQGNPGSYGYHVMSNTLGTTSWVRQTGYITGRSDDNSGAFETDSNYFSPLALFNYGAGSGTRACIISGWRIIKIDKQEYFADGTAALPAITNYDDPNTGISFQAADTVNISTGGTNRLTINSTKALFAAEIEAGSLDINGNADISGDLTGLDNITSTNFIIGGHTIDDVDIAGEFVDSAAHLLTSAAALDKFHVLNANTTGSAATRTTPRAINGVNFNGSAAITIPAKAYFDFKGYGTSDGTNYEMMEIMSDTNAPFEHNTSTGSDGLNAQTVNIAIRSGGHVMPHTGTIKKFSGWASSAGIGNVDIGIFRFRPVDNNNGNLTPVLMVNERISSYGNAIMKVFSETESFDADFEAGDIVFSAVKGGNSSPKTWYFTSILEVEWS